MSRLHFVLLLGIPLLLIGIGGNHPTPPYNQQIGIDIDVVL